VEASQVDVLADLAVHYFCWVIFAGPDAGIPSAEVEAVPDWVRAMSSGERTAVSAAAGRALASLRAQAGGGASEDQLAFLEVLASGELYQQWDAK
jgi:hypothetical protein